MLNARARITWHVASVPRLLQQGVLFLAVVGLVFSADCAKIEQPQPAASRVPKPAADLALRQSAGQVVLTVSMPNLNTDGSSVTTLENVEVFRLAANRGQSASPLPEEEFLKDAVRILSIPAGQFPKYLHDKVFVIHDELSLPDRAAIYVDAFRYAVRFINKKNQTAGLSNQAVIAPVLIPAPPTGLSAEVTENSIHLKWIPPAKNVDGSIPPRIVGFNVYRSEEPHVFPPVPLNPEPLKAPEFGDQKFEFDKTYYYAVSVVGSRENPYAESGPSEIIPAVARDIFPPGPPQNLNAVVENGIVILLWAPPSAPDVAGYRVYRKEDGGAERQLLQKELTASPSYRDSQAQLGKNYEYDVTAVDSHGNESVPARTAAEVR